MAGRATHLGPWGSLITSVSFWPDGASLALQREDTPNGPLLTHSGPRPHTPPLLAAPSCRSLGAIVCLSVQALGPPRIPQTSDLSWDRKGMGVALCGDASWSPVAHSGNSRNYLRHGNTKLGGAPGAPTAGGWGCPLQGDTGWARPGGRVHDRRTGPYPVSQWPFPAIWENTFPRTFRMDPGVGADLLL